MSIKLRELLDALPSEQVLEHRGELGTCIYAPVVEDSRALAPGGAFVARRGQYSDGHHFIPAAIAAGAAAIFGEQRQAALPLPYIRLRDAQQACGALASAYHGFPSQRLGLVGITGTDGKTTSCHLLHSIFQHAGLQAGYISTIAADFGAESRTTGLHVTTPAAAEIQAGLAKMLAAGCSHGILEMTSHGLAQGRLNGVELDVAVMTNVMHEHLDYHGSWQRYRAAKARMFEMLAQSGRKAGIAKLAVINADDPSAGYFAAIPAERVVSYSLDAPSDYRADTVMHLPAVTRFQVQGEPLELRLLGEFNIANALAALAVARELGLPWPAIRAGIAAVAQIPGRMERIEAGQDFMAIVDFAHTPNALARALQAGRALLKPGKRLIAVFGSAGLRDVQKRRLMAETSAQLADMSILTAEDPRTEALEDILRSMAAGCRAQNGREGETFLRIPDRGEAILRACQLAGAGDMVIACGKGHEQSMCFGTREYAWDDRDAMRAALRGHALATLPTAVEGSLARH